jgi:hypothetical protein
MPSVGVCFCFVFGCWFVFVVCLFVLLFSFCVLRFRFVPCLFVLFRGLLCCFRFLFVVSFVCVCVFVCMFSVFSVLHFWLPGLPFQPLCCGGFLRGATLFRVGRERRLPVFGLLVVAPFGF